MYNVSFVGNTTCLSIPACTCSQCGEAYFEGEEVDAIQKVIESVDSGVEKLRKEKATA